MKKWITVLVLLTIGSISNAGVGDIGSNTGSTLDSSYGPRANNLGMTHDFDDGYWSLVYVVMGEQLYSLKLSGCQDMIVQQNQVLCKRSGGIFAIGTLVGPASRGSDDMGSESPLKKLNLAPNLKYHFEKLNNGKNYALVIE